MTIWSRECHSKIVFLLSAELRFVNLQKNRTRIQKSKYHRFSSKIEHAFKFDCIFFVLPNSILDILLFRISTRYFPRHVITSKSECCKFYTIKKYFVKFQVHFPCFNIALEFLVFYDIICWVLETRHESKIDHIILSISLYAQVHRNMTSSTVLTYVAIMK